MRRATRLFEPSTACMNIKEKLMRKKTALIVTALLWLLVILGIMFCTLRVFVNRPDYFRRCYESFDMQSRIGISPEDCTRAVYKLVDYMEGREESIQLRVTEDGREVDMYNEQEILHMIDVRELYQAWRTVSYCALAALGCLLLMCLFIKETRRLVWRSYKLAWIFFGALLAVMLVWVLIDFNSFWTQFHYLFFDNDLWLMDSRVCRMIRICPLELFYGIVLGTVLSFAAFSALCSLILRRLYKKTEEKG